MANKVEICGINTALLPKLTAKEMKELMLQIKDGNLQARKEFIIGNMRLVLSVVQRFMRKKENPDDIFQVGCVGLIKAINNFDVTLNVKFSTYAVPMIIGEIRRFLRDNNSIRVSRSLRDIAYKALQAREKLTSIDSEEPTLQQIANEIELPIKEVSFAMDAILTPVSLFDPVYSDGADSVLIMDQIGDKKTDHEEWLENLALKDALYKLNEREKQIVMLRYYSGKTQMEVSNEVGISQAQVSRLEKNALSNLKKQL
jgi:RNA polymerase sporulation-specific sigma factor